MIGKTISHYKILEKLGEGGMGVVYKAEDTKLKRTVALKFLPPELTRDDQAKERFMQEAQAASKFDHPNICTIHEIDETPDGQTFIVMAHLEGETLKQKLAGGPLSADVAVDITIQVAQGLAKANEKGIVHRDIKPANIMATTDGILKILDFGLAKLSGATQLTKTGTTLGTMAYMSPEQSQGVEVDQRTDIWALGVIMYEMLSGQHPFNGDYEQAVILSILSEEPEPIDNLSEELEQIVQKALQKDRVDRYQNAEEMLSDLRAFQVGTQPPVAKNRTARPSRSRRFYLYGGLAALVFILLVFFIFQPSKPPPKDKIRLAVLPFDNITQNPDDEYFADGMTEEMISKLSQIAGIGVIARTSVMRYKTAPKSISAIGQELRVSKILEGSVRKAGDKLRITVQLVDVKTQEPIWSVDYDREVADVFAIQSEVAQQVALALLVELSLTEKRQIEKRGTENLEAYNLYLQGNYYANKRTLPGLNKGIEFFNETIKLDPGFALAYAGLAKSYHLIGSYGYVQPSKIYPKAKAAVMRALEIDDTLAAAHTQLASIRHMFEWDWPGAENAFKQAIALNPDYADAHRLYALFLSGMGRPDEALAEIERAQRLDPLSFIAHADEGWILYFARRYDESIEKLNKTIEMEPNFFVPYEGLVISYLQKGMYEEAVATNQNQLSLRGASPETVARLGHTYAVSGMKGVWQFSLQMWEMARKRGYFPSYNTAAAHAALDEKDQAFEWLERAYEERNLVWLKVEPLLDNLRDDPRFVELLKKMGLEE